MTMLIPIGPAPINSTSSMQSQSDHGRSTGEAGNATTIDQNVHVMSIAKREQNKYAY